MIGVFFRALILPKLKLTTEIKAMQNTVKQIGAIMSYVWNTTISGINAVIAAVGRLIAKLKGIVMPKSLTPGSPTPFEMGLRGIASAMDDLSSKKLPKLNAGLNVSQNGAGGRSSINNYTDNRRFSAGMDANALRVALDAKFKRIADNL